MVEPVPDDGDGPFHGPAFHDDIDPADVVADSLHALSARGERKELKLRIFGSEAFFRLWLAQVIGSIGDWLGFLAIVILAARVGAASPGASVGVVMAARIIPGFFFAAGAGVLIDRMDRRQVMVVTNVVRAGVVATLPFVDSVLGLVFASLVLELATLMFSPAKEAAVPHLVPSDHLTAANSLSLAAAYGTFPVASLLFAGLSKAAEWLGEIDVLDSLRVNQESLAFYFNVATYLLAAFVIYRLTIPRAHLDARNGDESIDLGKVFGEIKEGWSYVFVNPTVRAVNIGLATGLIGGGMLVPLGPVFSIEVLGAGPAGFGVFITALGFGVAVGVVGISVIQSRVRKARVFATAVFAAGCTLITAASMGSLGMAAIFVGAMGTCAGAVYVLGFTLLHENVEDELRGRIFSSLYTLVRLCVLLAFAVGPFLSELLDRLSRQLFDRQISLGVDIAIPGVRLTLWLAGLIMALAGVLAALSLHAAGAWSQEPGGAEDEVAEG